MSLEKPRFRRDLEARPVLAEGQSYVEVRDVAAGKSFLFYDFEYQVALAFDGLPLEKVIPWVKLATGFALQVDQLREFAQRLAELGFLEREPALEIELAASVEEAQKPETHIPNTELPPDSVVAQPASPAPSATAADEPASQPDPGDEPDHPPHEETPGPPPPDEVVMHPGEVVGETPPPVSVSSPQAWQSEVESFPKNDPQASPAATDAQGSETRSPEQGRLDHLSEPVTQPILVTPPAVQASRGLLGDEREAIAQALTHKASSEGADSTAFPVLPVGRAAPAEAPAPIAPPPWTTPRPLTTPRPVTLGPLVDRPSVRRRTRRSLALFGTLGILAAAALLAVVLPFVFSSRRPSAVRVRTLTVTPGTVYRYFEGAAPVAVVPGPLLKFPAAGKVTRVAGQGSTVAAGDVVAAVESARGLQTQLTHQRERLAYYQQMAEAMHQVGNAKEEERQFAKLEARKAVIAKTLRELANVAVIASAPGEVAETLAHEGQPVEVDSPAVRLRSPGFRATFELARTQAATARRLAFCQVEVEGYLLDCNPVQGGGDETHVAVDIPSVPPALVGKPSHLARARYSNGAVLPVDALQTSAGRVGVFVVPAHARLEVRPVAVAEKDEVEAIVVQGLDVGDRVVVEPTLGLRPGMSVGTAGGR